MDAQTYFDGLKGIRTAVEMIETLDVPADTRREAEVRLAWHHLMRAYGLLMDGQPTPDDLIWASEQAKEIIERGLTIPDPA